MQIREEFGWAIETKNKASKTADGELQASHKLDGISVKNLRTNNSRLSSFYKLRE